MNTIAFIQHLDSAMLSQIRHTLRAFGREVLCRWRRAAARREFSRLDAGALRDLGMSRSEFDSYWAESHGMAEPTRLRVMRHRRGVSEQLA